MKILYIGHYKENGGWAQAATDLILALDSTGLDVVCRNVTLTQDKADVDPRILALERKSSDGCDYCIQHVLPHHLVGSDSFKKNIAYFVSESHTTKHLAWFEYLKLMDEVWVPNQDMVEMMERDNFPKPVKLVHHAFDLNKYNVEYEPLPNLDSTYNFYFIGNLNDRKNLRSLLKCYMSEFDSTDNTLLILKVSKFGLDKQQISEIINEITEDIVPKMRLQQQESMFPKITVISDHISEEDIMRLHDSCDCFINISHGEAWGIPTFEAMAMGNVCISSKFGGPKEYLEDYNLVDGVWSVCESSDSPFPDLWTAKDYWFTPCELQTKTKMRTAYEDRLAIDGKNKPDVSKFSYQTVGQKMKEFLSEDN